MLDNSLYPTDGFPGRLLQKRSSRALRCGKDSNTGCGSNAVNEPQPSQQKSKNREKSAAEQNLEEEMDQLTDPVLLREARAYQQGEKDSLSITFGEGADPT